MQFKPTQKKPLEILLKIDDTQIEEVNEFKLLGVTIDSGMNWKAHIQVTKTKLTKLLYALKTVKMNSNHESALSIYFANIYSCLRYGVVLWGASTDANQLFIMQKKCIRVLANIRIPNSCRPYFIQFKLLTLPSIYIMESAIFARKHPTLFKAKIDSDKTRSQYRNKFVMPCTNLAIYKNSPYCKCIRVINKIPDDIKLEPNDKLFRNKLKNLLIEKCYYSVDEFLDDKTLT